jgi:uncharacterized membrane protein YpjA
MRARAVVDRLTTDEGLPPRASLPRYVAPLPRALENLGLHLAPLVAAVNLVGTGFGFWYYRHQFRVEPPLAWPVVPDSPVATLLIALSLLVWYADVDLPGAETLHALAFFGCLKLGLWTPYVQLVLNGPGGIAAWLYWFLVLSHLAMALEAFLVHRYAAFSVGAVAVAAGWYWFNDLVDYVVPLVGEPHHTVLRAEFVDGVYSHAVRAHDLAGAAAVTLTLLATFLALATRAAKLSAELEEPRA